MIVIYNHNMFIVKATGNLTLAKKTGFKTLRPGCPLETRRHQRVVPSFPVNKIVFLRERINYHEFRQGVNPIQFVLSIIEYTSTGVNPCDLIKSYAKIGVIFAESFKGLNRGSYTLDLFVSYNLLQ